MGNSDIEESSQASSTLSEKEESLNLSSSSESEDDGTLEVVDAVTTDVLSSSLAPIYSKPYNPEQFHDEARKQIAVVLLILLSTVIIIFIIGFFCKVPNATFDQYKSFLELLLTPLITLVSAATGFYFGSKK